MRSLCRKYGFSEAIFYRWKAKYSGMDASEPRRLRELEEQMYCVPDNWTTRPPAPGGLSTEWVTSKPGLREAARCCTVQFSGL